MSKLNALSKEKNLRFSLKRNKSRGFFGVGHRIIPFDQ